MDLVLDYFALITYLGAEFLVELTLSEGSTLTLCWIISSYLGAELLMEFMLS